MSANVRQPRDIPAGNHREPRMHCEILLPVPRPLRAPLDGAPCETGNIFRHQRHARRIGLRPERFHRICLFDGDLPESYDIPRIYPRVYEVKGHADAVPEEEAPLENVVPSEGGKIRHVRIEYSHRDGFQYRLSYDFAAGVEQKTEIPALQEFDRRGMIDAPHPPQRYTERRAQSGQRAVPSVDILVPRELAKPPAHLVRLRLPDAEIIENPRCGSPVSHSLDIIAEQLYLRFFDAYDAIDVVALSAELGYERGSVQIDR
jgi:hypothetical protein